VDLRQAAAPDTFDPTTYAVDERTRRLPPGQFLARKFPHLEYASIPRVEVPETWPLHVWGPGFDATQTLVDLVRTMHTTVVRQDFHCITGWSILDTQWTGVTGADLASACALPDAVDSVLVHGRDEFCTSLWLEDFLQGLLAWGYAGAPLSPAHGFPLRYVAPPHLYQFKSCKWLTGVEFLTDHRLGFWEIRAYSDSALVWQNDRYANPDAVRGKTAGQIRALGLAK
jgi:DMSO/TMAO reductase YedYZ molybdopterin-dependent catalytic subunit